MSADLGPGDVVEAVKVIHNDAGDVVVPMTLTIERVGVEARVFGTASLGSVDLPLPGVGRIDDFSFSVDTHLTLARD
jgi:hypothetical protein